MKHLYKWTMFLLAALALSACSLPSEAEIATCKSISPEYARYVEADPVLSIPEKARRQRLTNSWRMRVGLPVFEPTASELATQITAEVTK